MDRYQRDNAAHKIDGYYVATMEKKNAQEVFYNARLQCAAQLRRDLADVEAMLFEEFMDFKRGK